MLSGNKPDIPPVIWLIAGIVLVSALLQFKASYFIYQHDLMLTEPWRWWTAHLVHVGWRHYLLNMLALACLPLIFPRLRPITLLAGLVILSPLLSAGLYWAVPTVYAYAGLSGVLHGLYVVVALESLRIKTEQKFAGLVLLCIALKILCEKWLGYSQTAQLIQAPVLIESHQIGVFVGLVYALAGYLVVICWPGRLSVHPDRKS
ncbi:rhombosortase [Alkanindiges sp. WGS2144]|uniref:rhombosortase n=1 Tax=Alkanindiges sp. WGS2144 TaxID=3366808 RepID=UPI003753AD93